MNKISEWRYGVYCVGLKKRARTKNRHTQLNLGRGSSLDKEIAESCARAWVACNMKSVDCIEVIAHRMDLETDSRGVTMEHWAPFTKEDNHRWAIGVQNANN